MYINTRITSDFLVTFNKNKPIFSTKTRNCNYCNYLNVLNVLQIKGNPRFATKSFKNSLKGI